MSAKAIVLIALAIGLFWWWRSRKTVTVAAPEHVATPPGQTPNLVSSEPRAASAWSGLSAVGNAPIAGLAAFALSSQAPATTGLVPTWATQPPPPPPPPPSGTLFLAPPYTTLPFGRGGSAIGNFGAAVLR